jgi:hypothetical protein
MTKSKRRKCMICGEGYLASKVLLRMGHGKTCSRKCGGVLGARKRSGYYKITSEKINRASALEVFRVAREKGWLSELVEEVESTFELSDSDKETLTDACKKLAPGVSFTVRMGGSKRDHITVHWDEEARVSPVRKIAPAKGRGYRVASRQVLTAAEMGDKYISGPDVVKTLGVKKDILYAAVYRKLITPVKCAENRRRAWFLREDIQKWAQGRGEVNHNGHDEVKPVPPPNVWGRQ